MELPLDRPADAPDAGAAPARARLAIVLHWLPVAACTVLFAQIALLGLRPALCERRRLAEAEVALRERHARDLEQRARIDANLRARHDPIYRERQRRARQRPPAPVTAGPVTAGPAD